MQRLSQTWKSVTRGKLLIGCGGLLVILLICGILGSLLPGSPGGVTCLRNQVFRKNLVSEGILPLPQIPGKLASPRCCGALGWRPGLAGGGLQPYYNTTGSM